MKNMSGVIVCGLFVAAVELASTATASAQPIGTFSWQFAPFCNVVRVLVERKGSVFELTGTDDGCDGAAPASSANGSAHFNADGSIGMSLALVRPDGYVVTNAIALDIATLSGTWRDDWGNSGTFTFNPPGPAGGSPRLLTMRGDYSLSYPAVAANSQGTSSVSFPRPLPVAPTVNVIAVDGAPTVNCPGSVADPQAAPGHLCVYERLRGNVDFVQVFSGATGAPGVANPMGFGIFTDATAAGNTFAYGRWAVTVP